MKKYTYASIVPLIGGESIGIMQELNGQLPEYVLSYKAFEGNDSHYINYLRTKGYTGEYAVLDDEAYSSYTPESVDIVNTVCPCAGLSSLSNSSNAGSAINDWMYITAEYVLDKIKPKVFWGENAPRLFSAKGEPVADKLYEIGRKYGYSLNLYYTESVLHGISQKRPRTFYFLTREERSPVFPWYRKEMAPSETILSRPVAEDDPMNIPSPYDPYDNPWLQYCLHMSGSKTIKDFYDQIDETTNCITKCDLGFGTDLNEVADWMEEHGHNKMADKARRMQKKRDQGLGYWAYGITLAKGKIPSFISSQPHDMINPFTEKFLNVRESLRIMGMPDDFNMVGDVRKSLNHICQNVPVTTAQDMTKSIIKYLDGEVEFANSNYIKQNNKKQEVIEKHFESNTTALDSFFNLQEQ